jgi:hypothetical protein
MHGSRITPTANSRQARIMAHCDALKILAGAYFRGALGCSIVPLQFFAPQRHSQIFFMRAVWDSSRVMP